MMMPAAALFGLTCCRFRNDKSVLCAGNDVALLSGQVLPSYKILILMKNMVTSHS